MLNDLFITLAAGVISALPVQPPPAVVITADDLESSVVKTLIETENREISLDCDFNFDKLEVEEKETQKFDCLAIDETNNQKFTTTIIVNAKDGKVKVSAVVHTPESKKSSERSDDEAQDDKVK